MKILFLSQYYPPETGAGATRAETLRRYLTGLGWEIDVLCEIPNYPSGIIPEQFRSYWYHVTPSEKGSIIRSWVIPTRRESFFQQILMFASFMISSLIYGIMHPRKYDAVYATSPPIFGPISGLLLAKLYRIPFYFEVRDLWPDAGLETGHLSKLNLTYKVSKWIERWLYKNSDLVIPVTRKSEDIIRQTCPGVETCVIYNGVDTRHFRPVEQAQDKLNEPVKPGKFRVGYVGTIGVIHDLDTVIKAAKIIEKESDIELLIIGDGSRSSRLKQLLNLYKPQNVTWLGIRKHEDIPAYISSLDLALNPVQDTRVFESIITVKFFEYLACGVPVITSARGILRQVGEASGAALTIPPGNPEILAETLITLKNQTETRALMSKAGRPFVLRFFDREKWANELSDVLKIRLGYKDSASTKHQSIHDDLSRSGYRW